MGTAVALYITLMAGIQTAIMVFGLCVALTFALYWFTGGADKQTTVA
jgi:hypothetical protein